MEKNHKIKLYVAKIIHWSVCSDIFEFFKNSTCRCIHTVITIVSMMKLLFQIGVLLHAMSHTVLPLSKYRFFISALCIIILLTTSLDWSRKLQSLRVTYITSNVSICRYGLVCCIHNEERDISLSSSDKKEDLNSLNTSYIHAKNFA